jgi:hypothetical protein
MSKMTFVFILMLVIHLPFSKAMGANDGDKTIFKLWSGPEIPADAGRIPYPEEIEHRTIHDARYSHYKFLHGAAIIKYKDTFFASWANSPKDENFPRETMQARRAKDPLGDWSALEFRSYSVSPGTETIIC